MLPNLIGVRGYVMRPRSAQFATAEFQWRWQARLRSRGERGRPPLHGLVLSGNGQLNPLPNISALETIVL